MNTKYTPAPITIRKDGCFWSIERPVTEQERKYFGLSADDKRGMSLLALNKDGLACVESEGDAKLWAAAPALLEALEKCDTAFASWQVGQIPGRPEDILALITEVRAAITLVTAESQRAATAPTA